MNKYVYDVHESSNHNEKSYIAILLSPQTKNKIVLLMNSLSMTWKYISRDCDFSDERAKVNTSTYHLQY